MNYDEKPTYRQIHDRLYYSFTAFSTSIVVASILLFKSLAHVPDYYVFTYKVGVTFFIITIFTLLAGIFKGIRHEMRKRLTYLNTYERCKLNQTNLWVTQLVLNILTLGVVSFSILIITMPI